MILLLMGIFLLVPIRLYFSGLVTDVSTHTASFEHISTVDILDPVLHSQRSNTSLFHVTRVVLNPLNT